MKRLVVATGGLAKMASAVAMFYFGNHVEPALVYLFWKVTNRF